jgi:tellurite resistance protein TehA-like permease
MPERAQGRFREAIATLPPAYFAMVMATGIVSLAAHFLQLEAVAVVLLWINAAAYAVLALLTAARIAWFPRRILADLSDHARGPGFFTLPAGTCVLGSQLAVVGGLSVAPQVLWIAGIALWAAVTYGFFAAVTIEANKPPLVDALSGTWLVAVVAMQSIAVLGCLVAPSFASPGQAMFVAAAMHMGGFMLYLPLIALLLYRWTFLPLTPQQLTPPYWINMGALAISALAGARLLLAAEQHALVQRLGPFLTGATFFCWAAATWWIPLLAVLGFWRHVIRRLPLRYDPQYWGMVFPLGMYATSTLQMARALDLPGLVVVARVFLWPAVLAWVAVFAGLLLRLRPSSVRSG